MSAALAAIIAAIIAAAASTTTTVIGAASASSDASEASLANERLMQKQERQEAQQMANQARIDAIGERRQAQADVMSQRKFELDMQNALSAQRQGAMSALSAGLQNNLKNNAGLGDRVRSYFRSSL